MGQLSDYEQKKVDEFIALAATGDGAYTPPSALSRLKVQMELS